MSANLFESVPLDEKQKNTVQELQRKSAELLVVLEELRNPRCKALAITNLEQVVMWGTKAVSREPR